MENFKLYGRVFLETDIVARTGLHIGGSSEGLEIGGLDNAIIRNPMNQYPYIPGSSLKGKMRSLTEKVQGLKQNKPIGQVFIHACEKSADYQKCAVCQVFGVSASEEQRFGPTRLVVRDVELSQDSAQKLIAANTDLLYAELKTEVAIDRVTSAAVPRTLERVPAGAVFAGSELVFSLFDPKDVEHFKIVLDALQLVEDDYLGGSGSRGSGKVGFTQIKLYARNADDYAEKKDYPKVFNSIQEALKEFESIKAWIERSLKFNPK